MKKSCWIKSPNPFRSETEMLTPRTHCHPMIYECWKMCIIIFFSSITFSSNTGAEIDPFLKSGAHFLFMMKRKGGACFATVTS